MNNYRGYITANPHICHGKPCFKGTRVMIYLILELLEADVTPEEILKRYYPQLTKKHIHAALHYAAELIKTGEFIVFAGVA